MIDHLSPTDVALFVIGGLEPRRAREVTDHVVACDDCTAALAREAALEVMLDEAAREGWVRAAADAPERARDRRAKKAGVRAHPRAESTPAARLGLALAAAGALSLAAGWAVVVVPAARDGAREASAAPAPPAWVRPSARSAGSQAPAEGSLDAMPTSGEDSAFDPLDGG